MKALSLMQPMAWAIFHGKNVENRPMKINYRGPLLIHASKNYNSEHLDFLKCNLDLLDEPLPEYFLQGALLGTVEAIDCLQESDSRWFFGPNGLIVEKAKEFKKPVFYRGWPGLFNVHEQVFQLNEHEHQWVEEYYGDRCRLCGQFVPDGMGPWMPLEGQI